MLALDSRRLVRLALSLALASSWSWGARSAQARYIGPQLEVVPVERLAKNIQDKLDAKPEDKKQEFKLRLNLARLHAMSFAQKTDKVQTNKRQPGSGPWFGYEPKHVPFAVKKAENAEQQEAAKKQLDLAIAEYKRLLKVDPDNLTGRLGYAWCLEQAGSDMLAIAEYRKVIEDGWKQEKDLKSAGLGWHSVVAEAGDYLIPLLDKQQSADEIATIRERSKKLERIPRPIAPIAIPLRDGLSVDDLLNQDAAVTFNADGTGRAQRWTWITSEAAWLVSDPHGAGQIDSAIQMFGNVSWWLFWENGYQALSALDNDADGELTGDELAHLALWHDANGNGVSEPGEVEQLAAHGIVALSCRCETLNHRASVMPYSPRGVRFSDGTVRDTFDLILRRAK